MHISISCTVAILAQGTLSGRCVRRRPFWVRFRLRRFFILRSILSYSFFCLRLRVYRVLLSQRPRCSTSCPRKPRLHYSCQRPYRVECTGSLPNSEVKRRRARLVLGWGTAREDLRVLLAFCSSLFLLHLWLHGCFGYIVQKSGKWFVIGSSCELTNLAPGCKVQGNASTCP